MKVVTIDKVDKQKADRPIFTGGAVHTQDLVGKDVTRAINLTMVNFSAGARTKWHTHSGDQVLVITAGKGIVANEEKENVVTPGMVVHVTQGEKHWHGGTKDSAMSHISILPPCETKILE